MLEGGVPQPCSSAQVSRCALRCRLWGGVRRGASFSPRKVSPLLKRLRNRSHREEETKDGKMAGWGGGVHIRIDVRTHGDVPGTKSIVQREHTNLGVGDTE